MAAFSTRTLRGALAGAVAATAWAAQQPLDRRVFGVDYDDATLLGSLVTRDRHSRAALPLGLAMHVANGALFGALYARVAPSLPGPRPLRGVAAGLAEHLATWPTTRFTGLLPAGPQFPQLWGSRRAFAQATWRHALFGAVLGTVEQRLNPDPVPPAPAADDDRASSNGHGDPSHLVAVAPA